MPSPHVLAASITKAASRQTFYTIRFLADRDRVEDAYRAYAYFRWVDDTLDGDCAFAQEQRVAFLERQKALLENGYRRQPIPDATAEENMLIELVQHDQEKNSGLQSYLCNMMQVMEFDARRRGRLISYSELNEYTRWLATAVTEAMHHFIGHGCYAPHDETRYLAVSAAHIAHMLRDTFDDIQAGYYNIPCELLEANHIGAHDVQSKAYRAWVQSRVELARAYFRAGRQYLDRVEEPRCRLAGFAYRARFEWLLDTIESEQFILRPHYSERKTIRTGIHMALSTLAAVIRPRRTESAHQTVVSHSLRKL